MFLGHRACKIGVLASLSDWEGAWKHGGPQQWLARHLYWQKPVPKLINRILAARKCHELLLGDAHVHRDRNGAVEGGSRSKFVHFCDATRSKGFLCNDGLSANLIRTTLGAASVFVKPRSGVVSPKHPTQNNQPNFDDILDTQRHTHTQGGRG